MTTFIPFDTDFGPYQKKIQIYYEEVKEIILLISEKAAHKERKAAEIYRRSGRSFHQHIGKSNEEAPVIGMVRFGLVWRSNQTKPAAYIITGLI